MDPERKRIAKKIFLETIKQPPGKRKGHAARLCSGDRELLGEVETLLDFYEKRRLWSLDRKQETRKTPGTKDR